jgi:raffinose/stachyose/melibiose transport system substrate-binding protein
MADKLYDGFEAANPNVTVEREVFDFETFGETARTRIAAGDGPDLMYMDVSASTAGQFVESNLLKPLSEVPNLNAEELVVPWALQNATYDGVQYGVPTELEYVGVYWNETLMNEAGLSIPETAAEIPDFCRAAREKGYIPFAIGNNPGFQSFFYIDLVINNALGSEAVNQLLHQPGGRFDTPEITDAVELFYVDMKEAGCFPDDANAILYDDQNQLFLSGKALALPMGTWLISDVNAALPDADVSLRFFPKIQYSIAPAYSGSGWFVGADTEAAADVGKLLTYMHSDEAVPVWLEAGLIPAVEFDHSGAELNPLQRTALDALAPTLAGEGDLGQGINLNAPEEFAAAEQEGMQAVLAGTKTVPEVLQELQAVWEPVSIR